MSNLICRVGHGTTYKHMVGWDTVQHTNTWQGGTRYIIQTPGRVGHGEPLTTADVTTANVTTANVITADVTTTNVSTADVTTVNVTTADVLVLGYGLWVRVWVRVWVMVRVRV